MDQSFFHASSCSHVLSVTVITGKYIMYLAWNKMQGWIPGKPQIDLDISCTRPQYGNTVSPLLPFLPSCLHAFVISSHGRHQPRVL
jgi:hypothetical protein